MHTDSVWPQQVDELAARKCRSVVLEAGRRRRGHDNAPYFCLRARAKRRERGPCCVDNCGQWLTSGGTVVPVTSSVLRARNAAKPSAV